MLYSAFNTSIAGEVSTYQILLLSFTPWCSLLTIANARKNSTNRSATLSPISFIVATTTPYRITSWSSQVNEELHQRWKRKAVFDHPPEGKAAGECLFYLRQGRRSAQEFALEFRTLAADAGWNERALIDHFRCSLREDVRRELACRDTTLTFDQLVDMAIRLDTLLATRGRPEWGSSIPPSSTSEPSPMELGGAGAREERRRSPKGTTPSTNCGRGGHTAARCWGGSPRGRDGRPRTGESLQRALKEWSAQCVGRCLGVSIGATSVESPNQVPALHIPPEYDDLAIVFSKAKATQLPPHRQGDCAIDLQVGAALPRSHVYPLSQEEKRAMETYIAESLRQGYIRPSTSPASSSLFFVKKKDGGLRPCIDYRSLNQITVKYSYPLPLIATMTESLHGARFFTKLDLRSAYNLVRIREGDEWKTAFSTTSGHYEYLVMPYGLMNAPSVFQSFVDEIFRDMQGQGVVVYIDDILVYSSTRAEHVALVRRVLRRLLEHDLYVKAEKCLFFQESVSFLGYQLSASGVKMEIDRVSAVRNWQTPTTVKEVQRFLGFANYYRRFIRGFGQVAAPITSLLKGGLVRLQWSAEADRAFGRLKDLFTSAPVLAHPDPALPFQVEVDASEAGIGAVLSQRSGTPLKLRPCAFYSKKLSPAEQNYDVGDRELLAVVQALKVWRHWLEGAQHPFLILTDHRNLEYIRAARRLNPRQARWNMFLARFVFKITYIPGSQNGKADALSRRYDTEERSVEPTPILPPSCLVAPVVWEVDSEIERALRTDPSPPQCPVGRTYVPLEVRDRLIYWAHTSPSSGHPGIGRTVHCLSTKYWWPMLARDVRVYVSSCSVCAQCKAPRHLPRGKLQPLPVPQRPWSHLSVDFVTDLPPSQGNTTILVVVDRFSKACRLLPMPGLPTALQTAEALFTHVFRHYGVPEDIVSDRGPQFTS
ncbi:hypothetical protein J4Q44_G00260180 [Coregonus suidteri]|uniref:Gypsy retrotransposon integrase-like protein 1 n=1 Tax=Coregonus suidteri TaxID=861788 RepID=A0AAN8KYF0_9TELE